MFAFWASIIAAFIALGSQVMVLLLLRRIKKSEKISKLKEKYSNPLLKASEELYNKINDVIKNRNQEFPLSAFHNLSSYQMDIKTTIEIIQSTRKIYLAQFIYLFARFFGAVELIKRELGFVKLASDKETREFHKYLKRVVASLYSGRLLKGYKIKEDNEKNMKFHGRIIDGAQVLIGESMISINKSSYELISFSGFCNKYVSDEEFKKTLFPIIRFLEDIKETVLTDSRNEEVDFRWTKLIIFASYLRKLIKQMDTESVVKLLPEIEEYENIILYKNKIILDNIKAFEFGH